MFALCRLCIAQHESTPARTMMSPVYGSLFSQAMSLYLSCRKSSDQVQALFAMRTSFVGEDQTEESRTSVVGRRSWRKYLSSAVGPNERIEMGVWSPSGDSRKEINVSRDGHKLSIRSCVGQLSKVFVIGEQSLNRLVNSSWWLLSALGGTRMS